MIGVVHGVHAFMPILLEQEGGGHVVNTASLAGLTTGPGPALYSVTKFGVVALSEHLYHELKLAGASVSVSVLCPGFVSTEILKNSPQNRPAEFPDASETPTGPMAEAFQEWFNEQVEQGLSPRAVGDHVLSAIRDDRFYILTHPGETAMIEHRMKAIIAGENPTLLPPSGLKALIAKMAARGVTPGSG